MLLAACYARAQTPTAAPDNWRQDLAVIQNTLPTLDRSLYTEVNKAAFQSVANALYQDIPQLSDAQIIVRMAELIAMTANAHNSLSLTQNTTNFHIYPLRVRWFDDGLFVTAALPGAERAIGTKIISIGNLGIDDVYNSLLVTISAENDQWRRYVSQGYIVVSEVLNVLGIVADVNNPQFVFQDSTGNTFSLPLMPASESDTRWIYVPDPTSEALPLYRKQTNLDYYWFQYLGESRTLYFQYNACVSLSSFPFITFSDQLLAAIDSHPVDRLVIDLRNNTGGDSTVINPLLTGLQNRIRSGALVNAQRFVIIGRATISSGMMNAESLRAMSFVLAGEPTGGKPNHYGNVMTLTLPNSRLQISYPTQFFSSPITTSALNPDVPVPFPSSAFFQNDDPYLDAVLGGTSDSTGNSPVVLYPTGETHIQSTGSEQLVQAGYATLDTSTIVPSVFAVLRNRQLGVTISETTVTPSPLMTAGSVYAEVQGPVNTGLAIANPSTTDAQVSFQVNGADGGAVAAGQLTIPAGGQMARFLSEAPFSVQNLPAGALTFSSTAPIAVMGLRGYTNERQEFLMSTLKVTDTPGAGPVYSAHFTNGDGWTTQINLLNASDQPMSGAVEFVPGDRFVYALPPRSGAHFRTNGAGSLTTGFVRVIPDDGSSTPAATGVFGFRRNNVTVTEAGIQAGPLAFSQELVVSASGGFIIQAPGAIMSGLAIANPGATDATVQFALTASTGILLTTVTVPLAANTQLALFLNELFASIVMPFEGTLVIESTEPVVATGLRGQYNERGDFLISAAPVLSTDGSNVVAELADGGSYSTRLIFVSTSGSINAELRLFGQDGSPLAMELR
jgi:hypothetical protein